MKNSSRFLGLFARDALISTLVAAIALGPAATPAFAGPQGERVRRGDVSFDHVEGSSSWVIHASDGSVIEYDSLDIAIGEAVQFMQTRNGELNADARVLNRILGSAPTQIRGSLTGNGHIYIVNPAGVYFHDGATVNANAIHAAGGHLSDTDFEAGVDHYTGVTGNIENATEILARAVSLVGAEVVNSGSVIAEDGWIVIAAGNDVIIGREDAASGGRGFLLRVEGASGSVFDAAATGVTNTGTLDASAGAGGTVRIGAGDLYGTAIFSSDAIRAREIALAAGNRGDVALAGEVSAEKLDVSFTGSTATGALRTAGAANETVTVRADELKLSATGNSSAQIRVGDEFAFRSKDDAALGPDSVALEQTATIASSALGALDIGTAAAGTPRSFALRSTAGDVVIDDKTVVAGSHLALAGALADIRGTDALDVASLAVTGATPLSGGDATSEGDLVASAGGISVTGNLQLVTKPTANNAPAIEMLVSAHDGTLDVDGNLSTSAGGPLRIEARNVDVGSTTEVGQAVGGAIRTSGDVTIGFTDSGGAQQTQTVKARTIDTRGASGVQGGNVGVAAIGDVAIGSVATNGGAARSASQPNFDGGSVSLRTDGKLAVGAITTGGAGTAGRAAIDLAGGTVVLTGALDATGGQVGNADHARDRAVSIEADEIRLGAGAVTVAGSDVDLGGAIRGIDVVPATDPPTTLRSDLAIRASGATRLHSTADVRSLSIASAGTSVVLGGDVTADTTVAIAFDTAGLGTISNAGAPVTVSANRVELAASNSSASNGRSAQVALGDGIDFELAPIAATEDTAEKVAALVLDQDGAIDSTTVSRLADAARPDTDPVPDLRLELRSNDAVTLDATARADVSGTDLLIDSRSFSATGATQAASDFELSSLDLSTQDALDVDFGVTAESVRLAGGSSGVGDLTLGSELRADTIALVAGDDTGGGGDDARVVIDPSASLRSLSSPSARPTRVDLIQDAALDSADLPDIDVFGGSVAGLDYRLESRDAAITLSEGTSAKFAGSALDLRGRTGVNLGSEELSLTSLTAETPAGLVVTQRIEATGPDGKIRLRAGSDGTGNLDIGARLAANTIELIAGSGNGTDATSRIVLQGGARFSAASGDARPDEFSFEQDAAIGTSTSSGSGTALPDLAVFGGSIDGMAYALRSKGAGVRIDDASAVNGARLTLEADTGIDINADLSVSALDLASDATLSGNIASTGDVTSRGRLTLDGAGDHADQSVSAGVGILSASGAITKSGAGAVSLSGRQVTVASVTTGRTGDSLTISAEESVTAGILDASGTTGSAGGDVSVHAGSGATPGAVTIASITTRGGSGPVSTTAPEDGGDGGNVAVIGSAIAIGSVNSSGGAASAIATRESDTDPEISRQGGDAGTIDLTAGEITLNGNLDARGGSGASNVPELVAGLSGGEADVRVHGSVLLAANSATGGANSIYGDHVVVDGAVSRAAVRGAGETALVVVAKSALAFGGNLSADRIDLELATGDLDLAATGSSQISANTIRLAATDGNGGSVTSEVILTGLLLENEAGTATPSSLTIEQDRSIGSGGSPLPEMGGTDRAIALISHDGAIAIQAADVAPGTKLTLAANGVAGTTGPAVHVAGDLDVAGLTIGAVSSNGDRVDGDAFVAGDLAVGGTGFLSHADLVDVSGGAAIDGPARFAGEGDQVLRVGAGETLALGGLLTSKSTAGKLTLDADTIRLTALESQTIENQAGQLEIGSANLAGIVKGDFDGSGNPVRAASPAGLTLRGSAEAGQGPAVRVNGTREIDGDPLADGRDYAIAVADGDLTIDARLIETDTTPEGAFATWSLDGDVLAFGDVTLLGRGELEAGREDYVLTARRAGDTPSTSRGGELRVMGVAATDGNLVLRAEGDPPSELRPNPTALRIGGEFDVAHDLTLEGTTETASDAVFRVGGDVVFESQVRGRGGLSIVSGGVTDFRDDVALDGSALSAAARGGIQFGSVAQTQTISAGSLSFGSADVPPPPSGQASLFRNGDLVLDATNGNLEFARGERLIVAGDLDISSSKKVVLADTAALDLDVNGSEIQVHGGSVVAANHIDLSSRPSVRGSPSATFATPTREEVSGNIANADVVLRQFSNRPTQLTQSDLAAGIFPTVNGPALYDFAIEVPRLGRPASITRPRADVAKLASAREARPLWADEFLVYLDAQSRRAPTAREQGALPPVSAGPSSTMRDAGREVANPAAEQAIAPYRALFRPSTDVDTESGIVQGHDRTPEIREAFARAVEAASSRRGGAAPTAAEVEAAIEADPELEDARTYRADLGELVAAANRVLDADQRDRFRALLLARVTPKGITPTEFDALIP